MSFSSGESRAAFGDVWSNFCILRRRWRRVVHHRLIPAAHGTHTSLEPKDKENALSKTTIVKKTNDVLWVLTVQVKKTKKQSETWEILFCSLDVEVRECLKL